MGGREGRGWVDKEYREGRGEGVSVEGGGGGAGRGRCELADLGWEKVAVLQQEARQEAGGDQGLVGEAS